MQSGSMILVVEDDEPIREVLVDLLTEEKFKVHATRNGQEALDKIAQGLIPDLILLDLYMPLMNGKTFLKELFHQHEEIAPKIKVLILTAANNADIPVNFNSTEVLFKPLDIHVLLKKINDMTNCPSFFFD